METRPLRLELRMDATISLVSVTRRYVESALEKVCDDADLVGRAAVATHELLENAARYSRKADIGLRVTLERAGAGGESQVTLHVSNSASPAHVDRLKRSFAELDACEDPLALYVTLMRRNARDTAISGLGLARVRAEGEMTLALNVQGEVVTIVARTQVLAGASS